MKVEVDYSRCIGAGTCVEICPDVFELRDDGLAQVKQSNPNDGLSDAVKEAVEECPTAAILIEEEY